MTLVNVQRHLSCLSPLFFFFFFFVFVFLLWLFVLSPDDNATLVGGNSGPAPQYQAPARVTQSKIFILYFFSPLVLTATSCI